MSGSVAFAVNVTSLPAGQLTVEVAVFVSGQGLVMVEFEDWIETLGGRLQTTWGRLLKGRVIP